MGLSTELIDGEVPINLVCGICKDLFLDPVANSCTHVFCRNCIKPRLKKLITRRCPLCGTQLNPISHQPSLELKRRLLNLVINCSYGCGKNFPMAEMPEHFIYDCPNTPISCPNRAKGCKDKPARNEVEWHIEDCEYRSVKCEGCSMKVVHKELFIHQAKNKCIAKRLKQHVTRELRRVNLEVIKHRMEVNREILRLEADQRQKIIEHHKAKRVHLDRSVPQSATSRNGPFFLTQTSFIETRPQTTATSSKLNTTYKCTKCKKNFIAELNHNTSCSFHPGPIVELFGGTCCTCGHLDYQKGCCHGYHAS